MSLLRPPNVRPPGQPRSWRDWLYHPGVPTLAAMLFVVVFGAVAVYLEAVLSWYEEVEEISRITVPADDAHEPDRGDVVRLTRFVVVRSSLIDNPADAGPDGCALHLAGELGAMLETPGVQPDVAAIIGVCGRGETTAHVASGLPRLVVLRPVFDAGGRHRLTRVTIVQTTDRPTLFDAVGRPSILVAIAALTLLAGGVAWQWGRSTHRRLADLWAAAALDQHTGALRRETFMGWLSGAIAEAHASHGRLSVLCIDIDNLKTINDSLGHAAGDTAIRTVSGAITARLGADGIVGRLGGDEFCVLLGGAPVAAAAELAEAVRVAVAATEVAAGVHATVSIGVAELAAGEDAATLIRRADAALYGAKDTSRNQVVVAG